MTTAAASLAPKIKSRSKDSIKPHNLDFTKMLATGDTISSVPLPTVSPSGGSHMTSPSVANSTTVVQANLSGGLGDVRCVVAPSTDVITATAHGLSDGDTVWIFADGSEPVPSIVLSGTTYYVVTSTANTFQLALSTGGTPIDFTLTRRFVVAVIYTVTALPVTTNGDTLVGAGRIVVRN